MLEASEEALNKIAYHRLLVLVAVEELLFARERSPYKNDRKIEPVYEPVQGVNEAAFADLLVFEVGGEYFAKGYDFFDDYILQVLL